MVFSQLLQFRKMLRMAKASYHPWGRGGNRASQKGPGVVMDFIPAAAQPCKQNYESSHHRTHKNCQADKGTPYSLIFHKMTFLPTR